jgi:hypothetical protein
VGEAVGSFDDVGELSAWDQGDPLMRAGRSAVGMRSGMSGIISNAKQLGLISGELAGPLDAISGALQITAGGYQAYKAVQLALTSYRSYQAAAAAAETAAAVANPMKWPALALAAGASVAVFAALQAAEGEWDLPGADISSPAGQDQAAMAVGWVTNG